MMHKRSTSLLYAMIVLFMLSSCATTLYVAPKRVDCTGASQQKCYLIRNSKEGNWIMHYSQIVGLDYEPGFSYKIKVKKVKNKPVPMDGASFNYHVVDLVEKRDVTDDIEYQDLQGKEWVLESLRWNNTSYGIEGKAPSIQFIDEGKVSGHGGCNNFTGGYSIAGRTITFGALAATKMLCQESQELESAFFGFLGTEVRALFSDGKLLLSSDGGNSAVLGMR